jgi:DNA-binding CsgD family transcriptional regulator
VPRPNNDGVILLDHNLEIVGYDETGMALLYGINRIEDGERSIPESILDAIYAVRNTSNSGSRELASRRVRFHNGSHTCTCRIIDVPLPDVEGLVILYLSRGRSLAEALNQLSIDYHLTGRELEAIEGVVLGLTSKEVALRMSISPNTVKAFLRLVMGKMGVTTRSGIVAKLLDPNGHS